MKLMTMKRLREVIKGKPSDSMIYVQIGTVVYPVRADKVMTNLAGTYIRLVVDETQSRYEDPVE